MLSHHHITILASRLSGNFTDHPEISSLSRNFPGYPETFRTIWKKSRPSENFASYPENFQDHQETILTIRELPMLFGKFPGYPETFQTIQIQNISRLSENFPRYPETFQAIWKFSRLSGTFWTIRKISRLSGNFLDGHSEISRVRRKNSPDGNATMPPWFLGLCEANTSEY